MAVVSARIVQALLTVQVMPKGLQRCGIEGLEGESRAVCPAREAVHASQQVLDTVWLIPTHFQPVREPIEGGDPQGRNGIAPASEVF